MNEMQIETAAFTLADWYQHRVEKMRSGSLASVDAHLARTAIESVICAVYDLGSPKLLFRRATLDAIYRQAIADGEWNPNRMQILDRADTPIGREQHAIADAAVKDLQRRQRECVKKQRSGRWARRNAAKGVPWSRRRTQFGYYVRDFKRNR